MHNLTKLLLFFSLIASIEASAQKMKGDRILGWQIDLAENNNYDSAFAYGLDACMESVHLFMKWTDLEPDTGVFDQTFINSFLDVIDIYYPATGIQVELQIAPINTGVLEVPTELQSLDFDDPIMIDCFKRMLDTVFAHIPNVELSALNIGNEGDLNFGTDGNKYSEYKVFMSSVKSHAKALYALNQSTDLNVGTTFTFHGLTASGSSSFCQSVNDILDIVTVTYYPLENNFTMKPVSVVNSDFDELVNIYSDPDQPIYFAECGYASSDLCNSSEEQQQDFWREVFKSWDEHSEIIKYLTIFKSTDWSAEVVNELAVYYNLNDTIFKEYLRTLGVRTWPGNGTNKLAYEHIICELQARNWCSVQCMLGADEVSIEKEENFFPNPMLDATQLNTSSFVGRDFTLFLMDMHGKVVRVESGKLQNQLLIQRNDLGQGVYFYRLEMGDVHKNGKLIVRDNL